MSNYIDKNKHAWNLKAGLHVKSEFYDHKSFLAGQNTLKDIELALLGDVKGKRILHLQCHFGQDTLSLARMGAVVTGVDLSDVAIGIARDTATELNLEARFIACDLYDLPQHLDETFDMVFTSYGTIGWLPDLDRWAGIVSRYLKPGGSFVFAEFHPVVWMFDNAFTHVQYRYFKDAAIEETEEGTYADRDAAVTVETVSWNHGLAEVIGNLLHKELTLTHFEEYDYSPYACFHPTEEFEPGKFRIPHLENKIPMVYSLKMLKAQE
ncbi:MAG: class I SAM-dependent methyltransferase [Chitinophagaceae bacterium]|nr:class I SAM-dependent methyltransferase [Chitinophagaceae bacterium]